MRGAIGMANDGPFAMAGLWREWDGEGGAPLSFTMLRLNADPHPSMKRFPTPGSEKRSLVTIKSDDYHDWLCVRATHEARPFLDLPAAGPMTASL